MRNVYPFGNFVSACIYCVKEGLQPCSNRITSVIQRKKILYLYSLKDRVSHNMVTELESEIKTNGQYLGTILSVCILCCAECRIDGRLRERNTGGILDCDGVSVHHT